jgi:hypothetical protein
MSITRKRKLFISSKRVDLVGLGQKHDLTSTGCEVEHDYRQNFRRNVSIGKISHVSAGGQEKPIHNARIG